MPVLPDAAMPVSEREVPAVEFADEDVLQAMKEMNGYLDISLADAKALLQRAYQLALSRGARQPGT